MWNLHKIAESKARREDEVEDWVDLLNRVELKAREAGLNEEAFAMIIQNLKSDFHLVEIFEIMAEHGRRHPMNPRTFQLLTEHVDESESSLGDWLEAMAHICGWLYQQRKIAEYEDVLGYIHCCDMANTGKQGDQLLVHEVDDCLEQHGFERARDWEMLNRQEPDE
jgi:hypothetical protein